MNRIKKIKNKKEIIPLIFIFYPNLFRVFCVLSGLSLVGVFSSCSKTSTSPTANRPQVEVNGPITEDTIWESGKDYIVRGEVTVGENATLTIQKDVHMFLTLDSLGNKGKLYVKGSADKENSKAVLYFQ